MVMSNVDQLNKIHKTTVALTVQSIYQTSDCRYRQCKALLEKELAEVTSVQYTSNSFENMSHF